MNIREDGKVEILFNTTDILKFITYISKVNNIVAAIDHLNRNSEPEDLRLMETDGLPIGFPDEQGRIHASTFDISDWVFRKAFEDLIVGLTLSLIEAYSLLKLDAMAKRTEHKPIVEQEEFEKELTNIKTKGPKLNFPTLIDEIEKMTSGVLPFREEILSVNQVRNCLVHKNGIALTNLNLKYVEMRLIARKDGELVRITKELKKNGFSGDHLYWQNLPAERKFAAGEKITMNADIFKDLTYTCILFIHGLIGQMPLPDEIKKQIIQPFKIDLAIAPKL